MVRISKLEREIRRSIDSNLRRVYPLVLGPPSWGDIPQQRAEYHEKVFPLVKMPLIEAIPQYKVGENSKPGDLSSGFEGLKKKRLDSLGELLEIAGISFDLYPHQKESVIGYIDGDDVVVATGTGSGKTECFMFPVVAHLNDEAVRCGEGGEGESERAIKALILYPMNALVADQMSKLRALLGNPQMAARLKRNGYGRFPQFGMYTGRTDFHGWYSQYVEKDDGEGDWVRTKAQRKMGQTIGNYRAVMARDAAWKELVRRGKVPSIGGRIEVVDDGGGLALSYEELSPRGQKEADLLHNESKVQASKKRYKIIGDEEVFDRFNSQNLGFGHDHARWMGDSLDRELIARHQMHHGGLYQYLEQADGSRDASQAESTKGTGIPDVMVTNYSMLEYMLMRPLEHTFWHNTGKWLNDCERESDDPLRRRLLLIVDEAHMYQGAMGTEFSQLLNRLLAVLKVDRSRIHFIITSASLGGDKEKARDYASGLLSLTGDDNRDRRSRIVIPKSALVEIEDVPGINEPLDGPSLKIFLEAAEFLAASDASRSQVEITLLSDLFGLDASQEIEEYIAQGMSPSEARGHLAYELISESPWGRRLARLLLRPGDLDANSKDIIRTYYGDGGLGILDVVDKPLSMFPRRLNLVSKIMFDRDDEGALQALDVLLDLVASARHGKNRKPFLPLRAHIFVRGNGITRICSGCGMLAPEGHENCDEAGGGCGCLTYELYFDRNCGGSFLVLWLDAFRLEVGTEWSEAPDSLPRKRSVGRISRAHQNRQVHPTSNKDTLLGALAQVLPSEEGATHVLNTRSGGIRLPEGNLLDYEAYVRITNFDCDSGNYSPPTLTVKYWECDTGITEFRHCPYCCGDYRRKRSPQYSNTETRGDQFFSKLAIESLSVQDPNPESNQPHQGRKLMIFSDGRQRAARLARQLSEEVTMDEGRALLVYLHRLKWFIQIPEKKRSLHHLYPYLCALSGAISLNPLSDSTSNPDRSKMLSHTSSLAAWILIRMGNVDARFKNLYNQIFPSDETAYLYKTDYVWQRIVSIIKGKIYAIKENLAEGEESEDVEHLMDFIESSKGKYKIPSGGRKEYHDGLKFLNEKEHDRIRSVNLAAYLKIRIFSKTVADNDDLLTCMSLQKTILDDDQLGHLRISRDVFDVLLELLDGNDEKFAGQTADVFCEWMKLVLYWNPVKVPQSFGASLLRWLFDDLFGTVSLGLTRGELILDEEDIDLLTPQLANQVSKAIPAILLDRSPMQIPFGDRTGNSARRVLCNTSDIHGTGDIEIITGRSYFLSHENQGGAREGIRVSTNQGANEVSSALEMWLEDHCKDLSKDKLDAITNWFDERWSVFFSMSPVPGDATSARWNLRSDRYKIVSWDGKSEDDIELCSRCYSPQQDSSNLKCLHCDHDQTVRLDEDEVAKRYFNERLVIWRDRVIEIEKSRLRSGVLQIYRSEEHTAQISKKLNVDELYTGTEAHELQFQDIPIKSRSLIEGLTIEQPPIDILSCTTTMEVGIDIGSLTAVALRTVPPHAANYQQRVGRAGRGKSEVSLALTWIDNSAYAQSYFEVPERLVTHPSQAPQIYLKNQKIRERHLNALCFQLFFKRKDYDELNLTFEGMESGVGNLLESLGYADDFFKDKVALYGVSDMLTWLDLVPAQTDLGNDGKPSEKKAMMDATGLSPELLDFLLGKGVTPSFSFPLDVCKFVAEGTMDWRSKTWASTDQDLRVSLSEYAPGRVLTINKEDYRVGGLYYMMAPDRINRARHVLGEGMESEALLYYNRCYTSGCDFVHKDVERELLDKDCPVCMHPNSIKTKRFLKPEGFAPIMVPWDIRRDQQVTSQQKRNTGRYYCMKPEPVVRTTNETRAIGRVELPAPLMSEDESETMEKIQLDDLDDFGGYSQRLQLFGSRQKDIGEVGIELILVNSGFKDRGYYICRDCGRAEIKDSIPIMGDHSRPYAINLPRGASAENKNDANDACGGKPLGNSDQGEGILLGARFRSDLVSFRFKIKKPLERGNKLIINHEFNGGLLAIKEALITEVQREMKYVNREIGGGIRKFAQLDENGEPEYFVDIFLYDQVSGGAGLVTELADYPEKLPEIFKLVESRLSGTKCTSGKPCSRACVGCLLDFRNKTEHSKLDRVNGRRILKWLKDGSAPVSDFSSEEEDGNESSSIERLVGSISTIAGSSLRVRSEKPDGVHTVVVIESENGDKILRIRPVSSLARARSDPIIGEDYDYRREISSTADNQPGKGHMGFADMQAGFVPLVSRLKMDLNGEVDWS